jgi:hypothetical protein
MRGLALLYRDDPVDFSSLSRSKSQTPLTSYRLDQQEARSLVDYELLAKIPRLPNNRLGECTLQVSLQFHVLSKET